MLSLELEQQFTIKFTLIVIHFFIIHLFYVYAKVVFSVYICSPTLLIALWIYRPSLLIFQVWGKLRGRRVLAMLRQLQVQTLSTPLMAAGVEGWEVELRKESMTSTSPPWSSLPIQQNEKMS